MDGTALHSVPGLTAGKGGGVLNVYAKTKRAYLCKTKQTLGDLSRGYVPCKGRMFAHQVMAFSMKLLFARSLGLCYNACV